MEHVFCYSVISEMKVVVDKPRNYTLEGNTSSGEQGTGGWGWGDAVQLNKGR